MAKTVHKKRLVTSKNNLSQEQLDEFNALYPTGYTDFMMRIDKPNGDFFYAVPYPTEEIYYLVKVDVKVDDKINDDRDIFDTDEDKDTQEHLSDEAVGNIDMSDED
ncbi:MAG: hypothetical protein SNJ33_01945 [Rikenellaceae bacterium]